MDITEYAYEDFIVRGSVSDCGQMLSAGDLMGPAGIDGEERRALERQVEAFAVHNNGEAEAIRHDGDRLLLCSRDLIAAFLENARDEAEWNAGRKAGVRAAKRAAGAKALLDAFDGAVAGNDVLTDL